MSTSHPEAPQFVKLVTAVLTSTRGMVAVSAFVGSVIIAVVYLVFFQSSQLSPGKPKKRASPSKRSTSKQPVAKSAATTKKSPAKQTTTTTISTKKAPQANGQDKKPAVGEKKEQLSSNKSKNAKQDSSTNKKKPSSGAPAAVKPAKTNAPKSALAKDLKDRDSEWITVTTKKKPRKITPP